MKKLLSFLLLIIIILGTWYIFRNNSSKGSSDTVINSNPIVNGHPDASNATFTFDDGTVTLHKGTATIVSPDDKSIKIETDLDKVVGYGDMNNDKKEDAAVILMQSGGGSGVFSYLAGFVSGPIAYKGTNAVFIGDRIQVKSVSIKGAKITITYLDRKDNEPYAADPTVLTTKTFTFSSVDNSIDALN
jgi:hypothetical protein